MLFWSLWVCSSARVNCEEILKRAPHIDLIFGTHINRLPKLIYQTYMSKKELLKSFLRGKFMTTG